jgi:hypothetical protein
MQQTLLHLDIFFVLKPAYETPPGIYVFGHFYALGYWLYKIKGPVGPRVVGERVDQWHGRQSWYLLTFVTCEPSPVFCGLRFKFN